MQTHTRFSLIASLGDNMANWITAECRDDAEGAYQPGNFTGDGNNAC